jgi:hypothetical protein
VITHDRFIARSSDRDMWLAAREEGVTATMVAKASTPTGFAEVIANIENPQPVIQNDYMAWGVQREPFIALEVKDRFGVMPNEWLIAKDADLNRWQMATPDGLSMSHTMIAEIKTGGKPFDGTIPIAHRRQIQWQLYVTDAEACVYAFEQRLVGPDGGFMPDFEPVFITVPRDEDMIAGLIHVAQQVQQHIVYASWDERERMENDLG